MSKMPQIIKNIFLGIGIGIYMLSLLHYPVYSNTLLQLQEEITKKEKEIAEKESVLEGVERRIKEISSSNYSLSQKINLLNEEIQTLEKNIEETEGEIEEKVKGIEEKKGQLEKTKVLIDDISGDLYIQSRYKLTSFFLNGANWFTIVESLYVRKSAISTLKKEIEKIGGEFSSLAERKAELDKEKEDLDKQREGLDEAHKLLAEEKAKVQAELNRETAQRKGLTIEIGGLTKEISQLQQFLIYAKSGGTVVNISDIMNVGVDVQSTPEYFRENAPSGSFAVFSFGAYTWRKGLSQYGADMRAQLGQNFEEILAAYYSTKNVMLDTATMPTIKVRHCGRVTGDSCSTCPSPNNIVEYDFENFYMKKIAEMPENFAFEALKAQAVSARSYAIATTNYGVNTIDDDECDQAFNPSVNKPNWEAAVLATRNQVLKSGGAVLKTQYAAVHGGYSLETGWDSIDKSSNISQMYEPKSTRAGSYWFYRQWFRYGYSASGNDCGHTSPWLTNQEMADILNGHLQLKSVDSDPRVIAIDITKCWGKVANPYSHEELKNLVPNPVTEVYSVLVQNDATATTTTVSFNTNRGIVEMTGKDFKIIFSLRAPAYFRIPQNGSIVNINIEKK